MDISPLQTLISLIYTLLGSSLFAMGILMCRGMDNPHDEDVKKFLHAVAAIIMILIGAGFVVVGFVESMLTLAGM